MDAQGQQTHINDSLAAAQLAKLDLEIDALRRHNDWDDRFAKFLPFVASIIAIGGFLFTVWQAQRSGVLARQAQEKDRINKIQSQIRADKEQLLEFITNDKISSVRAAFLIDDLNSLIEQLPNPELEKQSITSLLSGVAWELRFVADRDVNFDVSALRRWPYYRQLWGWNPAAHHGFLVRKYYPRMAQLRAEDPSCVESLDYDEITSTFSSEGNSRACLDGPFPVLIYGYKERLQVLKELNNLESVRRELAEFKGVTNNARLTEKLLVDLAPLGR